MMHLTDEQIDELLMGSLEAGEATRMREHAAGCEACAAQLVELEAPLESFKAVTLAWSERRSATLPVHPAPRRVAARWAMGLAWGSLAAAALLAAVIPVLHHEQNVRVQQAYRNAVNKQGEGHAATASTPAGAVTPENSTSAQRENASTDVPENTQEIANDNRMLAMVDEELNAPITTPGSTTTQGHRHTQTSVQD
jgi:anti-sigma factor RsiW